MKNKVPSYHIATDEMVENVDFQYKKALDDLLDYDEGNLEIHILKEIYSLNKYYRLIQLKSL